MKRDLVISFNLTRSINKRRIVIAGILGSTALAFAAVPNTFNAGDVLSSTKLNANFAALVDLTSNQTVAGNKTFTGPVVLHNGVQADLIIDPGASAGVQTFVIGTGGGQFGANTDMLFNVPTPGNGFEFALGGADVMVISPQGKVGIANGNPATALQVGGDIRVGTAGTNGCLQNSAGGAVAGTCSSDGRFKQNVVAMTGALDKVARLRPVTYEWRREEFPDRHFGAGRVPGLIAQEVETVAPELVSTDKDGYKAVSYGVPLEMLALEAIKELRAENAALKERLARLEARAR
jgi:hypothetical protein